MEYLTVKEIAEKWGISERRLQTMCKEGIVEGSKRFGRSWAIPEDAVKPVDRRIKSGKYMKDKKTRKMTEVNIKGEKYSRHRI